MNFLSFRNSMKCILGKKLGMTTLYNEKSGAQPVTLVECAENTISCVRKMDVDGYTAIQLSLPNTRKKSAKREFRVDQSMIEDFEVGKVFSVSEFEVGDIVNVQGVSKGKGFQGVVKRHGFKGAPKTHGHKHDLRMPGSIGATTPQHVPKGRRMAGRMGFENVTAKKLKIVFIDSEKGIIAVKGAVPGIPNGIVKISASKK
jgi:large subunit ribosomal protein L3